MNRRLRFLTIIFISFMTTLTFADNTSNPTDSDSIKIGRMVFISGQGGGTIGAEDPNGAAIEEAFQSIRKIAKANGGSLKDIVMLNVFLSDLVNNFSVLNTIEAKYFTAPYPTRTVVGAIIPKNHTVEINAIMMIKSNFYCVNALEPMQTRLPRFHCYENQYQDLDERMSYK